jgi:hypothetical protein
MPRAIRPSLFLLGILASGAYSVAQEGIAIQHDAVGCIVAGKYPKLSACFSPAGKLARSRVYFRPENGPANWYYVEMKSDQPCFAGVLPKPKKSLIGQRILYYIDVFDQQFAENRTPDQAAQVVKDEGECRKDIPIAPIVSNASVTVFPAMPAGFAAAGLSTGAVVGIAAGGAAAVGGGVAVANSGGGGGGNPTTTTTTTPGANQQTTTTSTSTTSTTSTTLAPARTPFQPSFRINPDPAQGKAPLTVDFNMCQSRGENLRFIFDLDGDGVADFRGNCRTSATYTASGVSGLESGPVVAQGLPPTSSTTPGPTNFTYTTIMTVFEASETARPPVNTASATNTVTVVVPAPSTTTTTTFGERALSRPTQNPAAPSSSRLVGLQSQLDVSGGSGQIMVNGSSVAFARPGRHGAVATGRRGENRVEALLVEGKGAGTWRFELGGTAGLEAGSLRVIAGDVAAVTGDAIVFRLAGRPGERVVFTFRTGN